MSDQPKVIPLSQKERDAIAGGIAALCVLSQHVGAECRREMRADEKTLRELLNRVEVLQ